MAMNIVIVAWCYVVLMAAAVEAFGGGGSILGAVATVLLYGALPVAGLSYFKIARLRRRAALDGAAKDAASADALEPSDRVDPGRGRQAAGELVAAVREEA